MNCVVTAGPTYEPLDKVRRLTNFSTGRLGAGLATFLTAHGHSVTLLLGELAVPGVEIHAKRVETFGTTEDLHQRLLEQSTSPVDAVFHAAAVSDFRFGKVWLQSPQGQLIEVNSGKISTRHGTLLAQLLPTGKIIAELRDWFPRACLIGWKYEVDGDQAAVFRLAEKLIHECRLDACVANGPAYGEGFGLVTSAHKRAHLQDMPALFEALENFIRR